MKLRNKKTGEIVEVCKICPEPFEARDFDCKSLAELNEVWEDYKEPKKHHYYIEPRGQVIELDFGDDIDELIEELSEIGNYFETKEEAEKAVEKLKAWKRLKDKGFEINYWAVADNNEIRLFGCYSKEGVKDDLDLLFEKGEK